MLNERLGAAQDLASKLFAVEAAIDEALAQAGLLTCAVPAARRRAGVSAVVGQEAIALTGQSLAALHEARAKIVAAHHAFAEVQAQVGLKSRMSGDGWKPSLLSAEPQPLKLVADQAA